MAQLRLETALLLAWSGFDAAALETTEGCRGCCDKVFGDSGSSGFKDSNAVSAEITRLALKTSADGFAAEADAQKSLDQARQRLLQRRP